MNKFDVDLQDDLPSAFGDRAKTPSPDRSNKSIRISATPTPPKIKSINPGSKSKVLKTPDKTSKSDKDPLKNIKLDHSLSSFLANLSKNPAIKNNKVNI